MIKRGKNKEKIVVDCVFFNNENISKVDKYSFKVVIERKRKLRSAVNELLKDKQAILPEYVNLGRDCPMVFKLYKEDVVYGSDFGIKYGLNKNGSLRCLKWYEPTLHDWTYEEIVRLKELGVINGDIRHIIVEFPEGLGVAGGSGLEWGPFDLVNFISGMVEIINFSLGVIEKIKTRSSINKIRKNGFIEARDIRNVLEKKDKWTLNEVRRMFRADDATAMIYLLGLGFVDKGKYWAYYDNNSESLKMRAKWIEGEKKIFEEIEKCNEKL